LLRRISRAEVFAEVQTLAPARDTAEHRAMSERCRTRLSRPQPRRLAAPASPAVRFWRLLEAGAWEEAHRLLDPGFVAHWPQSGECFRGPDDFLAVNRAHPAPGWALAVHRVVEAPGATALQLTLEHAEGVDEGACFYVVARGRIVEATELWAERTPKPAWRACWSGEASTP
jgi:hypothetical protein